MKQRILYSFNILIILVAINYAHFHKTYERLAEIYNEAGNNGGYIPMDLKIVVIMLLLCVIISTNASQKLRTFYWKMPNWLKFIKSTIVLTSYILYFLISGALTYELWPNNAGYIDIGLVGLIMLISTSLFFCQDLTYKTPQKSV